MDFQHLSAQKMVKIQLNVGVHRFHGNETWKFTSNENVVEATGFYGIDVRSDDRFMVGSARFARSKNGEDTGGM